MGGIPRSQHPYMPPSAVPLASSQNEERKRLSRQLCIMSDSRYVVQLAVLAVTLSPPGGQHYSPLPSSRVSSNRHPHTIYVGPWGVVCCTSGGGVGCGGCERQLGPWLQVSEAMALGHKKMKMVVTSGRNSTITWCSWRERLTASGREQLSGRVGGLRGGGVAHKSGSGSTNYLLSNVTGYD